jgi:molybdopterin-guanine dinucleotide biosynthesis protein B
MKDPKIIGFYGYSGSGKTTLIERLCRDLRAKGTRFAVIKQTDKAIRMDQPGKDTYRFQDAGAAAVALASKNETDIIVHRRIDVQAIIEVMKAAGEIDLVIVESCNDPALPKIRLGEIAERDHTLWTYDGDFCKLVDMIINLLRR